MKKIFKTYVVVILISLLVFVSSAGLILITDALGHDIRELDSLLMCGLVVCIYLLSITIVDLTDRLKKLEGEEENG